MEEETGEQRSSFSSPLGCKEKEQDFPWDHSRLSPSEKEEEEEKAIDVFSDVECGGFDFRPSLPPLRLERGDTAGLTPLRPCPVHWGKKPE